MQAWISHEKYNDNTLQNDIGLVAFNSSVDAPTVALSDITDTANMPNPLYVAGFGLTESEYLSGSISVSSALMYVFNCINVTVFLCEVIVILWWGAGERV